MLNFTGSSSPLAVFTPFLVNSNDVNSGDGYEVQNSTLFPVMQGDPSNAEIASQLNGLYTEYYPREELSSLSIDRTIIITWQLTTGIPGNMQVSLVLSSSLLRVRQQFFS